MDQHFIWMGILLIVSWVVSVSLIMYVLAK
ncbi:hypothetical protein SAMN04489801_3836 [Pseudomonas mandelii]|uniref:DUF2474 domain-containing protein n=1 Tax=Pseudomonas mandelii TaxID=75612 RepID=A0ABY0VRI7_9PSED|nr:hypothetical protein SAMN04489801_3836 [Pseudomonas mandelii]